MSENIQVVLQALPFILQGLTVTLSLVLEALLLGFVLGLTLAVGQVYGNRYISGMVSLYVWFFRGLPNLVLLFLFYFGLFPLLGLDVSAFVIAVIALGLRSSAYQSQVFRGAIQSLGEGQMLAARSLGMSRRKAIINIILPQALRIALPGWSNEYPILLTDSAVTYAIGVMEILTRGSLIVSRTYKPMPLYLTCAVIFILLNYGGMKLLHILEKQIRIPGFGSGER
jgi:polar amino acid transport system permease protein